jgi:hypothetical protein
LRINVDAKLLLNRKNHILKNEIITDIETSETKENITLHHTREEESNNNLGTNKENLENKDSRENTEQHMVRNK